MSEEQDSVQPDFVGLPVETDNLENSREVVALTNSIGRLESSLDAEKEERLEERFTWVCAVAVLFDILAVSAMNGSWLFLPIFMLQLVVLIGLPKGVELIGLFRCLGGCCVRSQLSKTIIKMNFLLDK